MEEKNIALLEKETVIEPIKAKAFSSKTYPQQETEILEQQTKVQSSSVVEKPNYDFIEELSPEEEKKIYKIEKENVEQKPSTFAKRLRIALFSLVISVCSIWGITNIVTITNLQSEISAITEVYQLNLANYLAKLGTMDTASNYNELFETYPQTPQSPTSVAKSSNWFDRLCNFIAGLFGG